MDSSLFGTTFCLHTFGCQMNKHDSEKIAGMLEALGSNMVSDIEGADIVVFMTCCVREAADTRLYGQVASIKNIPIRKNSPLGKRIIAVGGCIGQRDKELLVKKLPHLDIVFGTHNLSALPRLIENVMEHHACQVEVLDESKGFDEDIPEEREHAWSAWLPITIGCINFCSYCIVPYVRGREKSRTMEDIESEAARLVKDGVKEITLLGQNVNSYGRDLYGEPRFAEILDRVSATGVERLRFATSHPKDLNDEVIGRFSRLENLMPALHLPAQSGSDAILKAMNRRYTHEHYLVLIDKLREARPDIALSTDLIVGFPGESEGDFERTLELVREVGYTQVFTFIYSKREGTPAASMPDNTPREVIQERFDRLVEEVQAQAYAANQQFLGKTVDVLVEGPSKKDSSMLSGKSPHNVTVHAPVPSSAGIDSLTGTTIPVHIDEARTWYISGHAEETAHSSDLDNKPSCSAVAR
ncbi:MAG: tRNA (N6-isopentenyl adenosine(37)-C2)-methylthiotransferase MiaB [Eggerthellaceae bacterium]|nr:tRNA (N6-isopentenyl adenosine(37)-C2)-methylthiotransferase MiaB [Eggerthellaceae bacterium]